MHTKTIWFHYRVKNMNVIVFLVYTLFLFESADADSVYLDKVYTNQSRPKYVGSHELLFLGWYIRCKLQPNGFNCNKNETNPARFYYDYKMQTCRTFQYGECELSFNTFKTLFDCTQVCSVVGPQSIPDKLSLDVACRLQPDFGTCNSYYPMWYFDVSTRKCKGFSYSGCGGNQNRFATYQVCAALCLKHVAFPKRVQKTYKAKLK